MTYAAAIRLTEVLLCLSLIQQGLEHLRGGLADTLWNMDRAGAICHGKNERSLIVAGASACMSTNHLKASLIGRIVLDRASNQF
jgi:hypothetical protein